MHTSGKIFLFLMVLAWGAGLYFTVKVMTYRSAWLAEITKQEKAIETAKNEIAKEKKERQDRQSELDRAMVGWGSMWNGVVAAAPDPATGSFQIRAEDGAKLPYVLAPNQVVWIFTPSADGNSSTYAGDFKVTAAAQGAYSLAPNFRPRLADPIGGRNDLTEPLNLVTQAINPRPKNFDAMDEWGLGRGPVRVRTAIPTQHANRFVQLEVDLVTADERLTMAAVDYSKQAQMLALARTQAQKRAEEITGSAALADKDLPPEIKLGLLQAMQDEDEARNKVLLSVDDLRHRLKRTNDRFNNIRKRNTDLEQSLPQPADDTATARAGE